MAIVVRSKMTKKPIKAGRLMTFLKYFENVFGKTVICTDLKKIALSFRDVVRRR